MKNIFDFLLNGGPVVWALLCCSIIALTVFLYKIWQFWGEFGISGNEVNRARELIGQGKRTKALILINGRNNPRAKLMSQVISLTDNSVLDISAARNEALRIARQLVAQLNSHLRVLEVIAMIAPLLGLLGTVLGMIEAFKAMEAAGSQVNPAILSGGIWQALLTTAVGMAVAIPVSVAHSWLERRVEVEASVMQDDLEWMFTLQAQQEITAKTTISQSAS